MVGCKASTDGSVMTSHTCDSHDNSTDLRIVPAAKYKPGDQRLVTRWEGANDGPMKRTICKPIGQIPQVPETFGYVAGIYGIMNDHQLAIGESTFGGRDQLVSQKGLIDCDNLTRLMLERAKTARDAIRIGGGLIERYGWNDVGEALTIADTKEVWLMEIVGPGKGAVGAAWAAQRIPDDQVSVVANGSRIGEIDLKNPDYFMASKSVFKIAEQLGCWDPKSPEPFRFYEAYSPNSRYEVNITRREWRVLDLLAPSLRLHPNRNHFPLSVKPEKPVGPEKIMELFRDTFEGTNFDMTSDLTITDESGKTVKSPLANPFPPYELNKMLRLRSANAHYGERCLARFFCIYATVTQSRGWLPDPVGGIVWLGYGNPAMSTYVPIYAGVSDLPEDFIDRRPSDGHQPPLGVVGVQAGGDDFGPSLGRDAPRRGRRPQPLAGAVPGRAEGNRRAGPEAPEGKPGQGPRLPHRKDGHRLPHGHSGLLDPRRPALEQVRRAVVAVAHLAAVRKSRTMMRG